MMMLPARPLSIAVAATLFAPSAVWACRYNVRDVGFVDLGMPGYRAVLLVDDATSPELIDAFGQASPVVLLDSNVTFETVHVRKQAQDPVLTQRRALGIQKLPAVVFVSAEGEAVELWLDRETKDAKKAAWTCLERAVVSPVRERILTEITEAYAVILLMAGPKKAETEHARRVAKAAIAEVAGAMHQLPKAVKKPPVLIEVPAEEVRRERVLLWSLGLEADRLKEPHAAVLYGRGRWVGPMFRGDEIITGHLLDVLALVGANCECGLDRRIMLGTRMPTRWDGATQERVIRNLGFDPENPMARMEISRIISRGPGGRFPQGRGSSSGLLGYSEEVVAFDAVGSTSIAEASEGNEEPSGTGEPSDAIAESTRASAPPAQAASSAPTTSRPARPERKGLVMTSAPASPTGPPPPSPPMDEEPEEIGYQFDEAWYVGGGMIAVIVAFGGMVLLRGNRRNG